MFLLRILIHGISKWDFGLLFGPNEGHNSPTDWVRKALFITDVPRNITTVHNTDLKDLLSVDPSRDYIYDELGDLLRVIYPDQFPKMDAIIDGTDNSHSSNRQR